MRNPSPLLAAAVLASLGFASLASTAAPAAPAANATPEARVSRVLEATPLIDGHNDLPWRIREDFANDVSVIAPENQATRAKRPAGAPDLMTDITRLHAGQVGGQFWSVWIPVSVQGPAAVQTTLEQIDIVKRLCNRFPGDLELAFSADDIRRIHKAHRTASLIGIEGGHQINNSLAVLRQMYDAGARYMTLTHTTNTGWADSATDAPQHGGLTAFGEAVVREMNRLGMLVDLSHVSEEAMVKALAVSRAPVIYSHSSARALADHPRNVSDAVLKAVAANGGVVMVNFAPGYVSDTRRIWDADQAAEATRYNSPPYVGLYIGQPDRAKAALAAWEAKHPRPHATLAQVADHIEHIRTVAGIDHVGLGSDFDGIDDAPDGLDGVDRYPALLAELARRGWTDADLAKLAGGNLLRVFDKAAEVSRALRTRETPGDAVYAAAVPDGAR